MVAQDVFLLCVL